MTEEPIVIRPAVMKFAEAMERTLRENDNKKGWRGMTFEEIFDRVSDEYTEAKYEMAWVHKDEHYFRVAEELIDTANFCMMFWDNLHPYEAVKPTPPQPPAIEDDPDFLEIEP